MDIENCQQLSHIRGSLSEKTSHISLTIQGYVTGAEHTSGKRGRAALRQRVQDRYHILEIVYGLVAKHTCPCDAVIMCSNSRLFEGKTQSSHCNFPCISTLSSLPLRACI